MDVVIIVYSPNILYPRKIDLLDNKNNCEQNVKLGIKITNLKQLISMQIYLGEGMVEFKNRINLMSVIKSTKLYMYNHYP